MLLAWGTLAAEERRRRLPCASGAVRSGGGFYMRQWVVRFVRLAVVLAVVAAVVGCGGGGGGVLTLDRIGKEDAPNTMTLQLNASYTHQSPTPSWADGFEKLFTKFAEDHPDWKLELGLSRRPDHPGTGAPA